MAFIFWIQGLLIFIILNPFVADFRNIFDSFLRGLAGSQHSVYYLEVHVQF